MYRTDDPHKDFDRHDAERQKWLRSMPKCCECGEHIQDYVYVVGELMICDECMENHRHDAEDFRNE
jgi:hypothetical protein